MPSFFWLDLADLDGKVWSVASTFHGFSPEIIAGMELSFEPLTGLLYWYEGAKKIEESIGETDK